MTALCTRYCVLDTRDRDFATDLCHFRTSSEMRDTPTGSFCQITNPQ